MDVLYNPDETTRVAQARESFSGVMLTDRQFNDAMAITGVIERRIHETGSFKDCLNDFANAFARTEQFDIAKADSILRDHFKIRTGVSMNQMREALMENEKAIFEGGTSPTDRLKDQAYNAALDAGRMVEEGNKITFYRAASHAATTLARDLNITDAGAKKLMSRSFEETENRPLRDWGKELDETFYHPQIEAEKQQRREAKSYSRSRSPSYA